MQDAQLNEIEMRDNEIRHLKGRIAEMEDANTRLQIQLADAAGRLADEGDELDVKSTQLRLAYIGTIQAIARAIEAKDPFTQGHSELVAKYSMAVAQEMGYSWAELERIQMAGMLLNVGKIGVPSRILTKREPLTPEETEIMRRHVELGAKILEPVVHPWEIASLVYQHHERMDGSGYPKGITGERIAPMARILGLIDEFCAMETDRAYRAAHPREAVIEHIQAQRGVTFDADVVDAFLRVIERGEEAIFRELDDFAGFAQ